MVDSWDPDIAALNLTDVEKNGLQVFRNYTRTFEKSAAEHFVSESNSAEYDTSKLDGILNLIVTEDVRFLPVIACSFSDEQLEEMFKREIPSGVPGGRSSMLSGYGSLSRFSQRIQVPAGFSTIAETFVDRIDATLQTTATPYLLGDQAAHDKHFQRISMAARIRSLKILASGDETAEALEARRVEDAHRNSNQGMAEFCASEESVDAICSETARFLLYLHKKRKIASVARELLLQGTFSTWSALEMLIGDGLVLLLNSNPKLVTKLLSDPSAKKKFELPKLSADYLAEKGFDLSTQMGSLLFEDRDLSSLAAIRIACEAIFEDSTLRAMLNADSLWLLNQKRHLIAHRRGVVDDEYVRNTGSSLSIGDHLHVSPSEFEENLMGVLSIGQGFLNCVSLSADHA
mgnify:CR=1 FL=1|jgi:hypothetical protein